MGKNVIIKNTYEAMSAAAAEIIEETVRRNPEAVIVLATGHSPLLAYRIFVESVKKNALNVSGITFVKLDEWLGPDSRDEATCEYFLRKEVLDPLNIKEGKYLHFLPEAKDEEAECARIEKAYGELDKIDLVILGIGKNGHLGLNEPGESLLGGAHVVDLDIKTKSHEMLSHTKYPVAKGITLGMENLFRAEKVLLLADGKEKEKALSCYLDDQITTKAPVSLLKLHADCQCIVNRECFGKLEGLGL